ncbi:E3 ubiquitin/ISG15 ligase TRIM25-like [Myxocyprinus asiaticus]|uniref:E3 ubiquitin/ISG15 ligase TRIM25-like n=1 Tax=Myxocyprinus asiaticus TaxID=70543 RepID=UPI002221D666|nr:E3 ubiquitin/ISG15 ligase TRIM25-like [Myxocyprinus asiaticus]
MAGSSSDAQNPLNCPICLDILKDPVTTSCGHSFCMGCIMKYWNSECQRGVYSCPNCRKTFNQKPNLSRSTVLVELVQEMKDVPQAGPKDMKCDVCKGRKLKAIKSCLVCLASYCQIHLHPHYESDAFKNHNLVNAFPQLKQQICSQHHKALEIYCHDDGRCICVLCLGDHIGHRTVSAAAEMAQKQKELKSKKSLEIIQKIKDIEKNVQELKKAVDSHKRSAQAALEHSERIFKELIRSIHKKQSEVRVLIRAQEKKEVEQAENHIRSLEQQIGNLKKDNDLLEQVLHTEDHIYFFQNYSSSSGLLVPVTVPKAVNGLLTFKNVENYFSELKSQLNQVFKEHMVKISRKVAEVQIFKATMFQMSEPISMTYLASLAIHWTHLGILTELSVRFWVCLSLTSRLDSNQILNLVSAFHKYVFTDFEQHSYICKLSLLFICSAFRKYSDPYAKMLQRFYTP